MNHTQTVAAVARRLRQFTKRDVGEVLTALTEVWRDELVHGDGSIRIDGLGKLYIEQQQLRSAGVIQARLRAKHGSAPMLLDRYYFRFRPTERLHTALLAAREERRQQP